MVRPDKPCGEPALRWIRVLSVGTVAASIVAGFQLIIPATASACELTPRSQSRHSDTTAHGPCTSGGFITGEDGVKTWVGPLARYHVTGTVNYPTNPPIGGPHNPVLLNCDGDVYTKPVRNENAVHSLEHGAVWVTYNSKASEADVQALAEKVRSTPYTMMSPYEKQKDPMMLTAWGHQRTVTSASDPNVDRFFETYAQGAQTPEPGAPCTGGAMQ
ncbi:DUF3105 domain-containing protein [Streptomyces sp. NPDC059680]|uniref:DUF3105 domain-containing protein n=1 Tax=Streptomyces sp. NPDC059680 TaxID=3346904 RepID=UPI003687F022